MNRSFSKFSKFFKLAGTFGSKYASTFLKPKIVTGFALSSSIFSFLYMNSEFNNKIYTLDDRREIETINATELQEGETKAFQYGPDKEDVILLHKYDGKFYATAPTCPHLGAPLEKGVRFDDKLYCPWHAAAFSILNGKPEQGPVFDNLPVYEVFEREGKLVVKLPRTISKSIQPELPKRFTAEFRKFVIVGGGPAALSAVETLRRSGFRGEIILITNENELPYDRTVLSKNIFGADLDKITIRDQNFFNECEVTIMRNTKVKYLNIDQSLLEIEGKDTIKFDKLLIATGGRPRVPPIHGTGLNNVLTLRNYKDMSKIKEAAANAKTIVVIGASFIGMEVAANIKNELKDNVEVIVVDMIKTPFSKVLGDEVGEAIKEFHEKNGVKFYMEKKLKTIEGAGSVKSVVLQDGTEIPTDLVILGTGIKPNTEIAEKSMRISDDGGIYTDIFLKTSIDDIYAAGDVASYPYWYTGNRVRIEHYNEAIQQGQVAAYNMLDKKVPYTSIPFFWSRQFNMGFRYVGYGGDYDNIHIDGNPKEMSFLAYYAKGNRVVAAASVGRDPAVMIINQAMQSNVMPSMEEIKSGTVTIEDIKSRLKTKQGCSKCKRQQYEQKPPPGEMK